MRGLPIFRALLLAALVAGCAQFGAGPSSVPLPSHSASPSAAPSAIPSPAVSPSQAASPTLAVSPAPIGRVESVAQAVALVLHQNPEFGAIGPLRSDVVGQSAWYEARRDMRGGFRVSITLGSGDCPAGCIERHTWTYLVSRSGEVTLDGEEGDDVGVPDPSPNPEPAQLRLAAVSDATGQPRPVESAEFVVRDALGNEVARGTTSESGSVSVSLPAGAYFVEPLPMEDYPATPEAQAISLLGGDSGGLLFTFGTAGH